MDNVTKKQRLETSESHTQKQTNTTSSPQPKVGFVKPFTFIEDLEGCTQHLTSCNRTLKSAVESLRSVTKEFSRQSKFMEVDRSYDLVTEDDIKAAQKEVVKEVGPEIQGLLRQVDVMLENMAMQEQDLARKVADQDKLLQLHRQGNHIQQKQDDTAVKEAEARLQDLNERLRDLQKTREAEERRYNEQKMEFDKIVEENRLMEAELEESSVDNQNSDVQETKELEAEIARWDQAIAEKEALLAERQAEKVQKNVDARKDKLQKDERDLELAEAKCLMEYQEQLEIVFDAISKLKVKNDKGYSKKALEDFYTVSEQVLQSLQETTLPSSIIDSSAEEESKTKVVEGCIKQLGSLFRIILPSYALSKTATRIIDLLLRDEKSSLAVSVLLKEFPMEKINKHHLIKALKILLTAQIIEANDATITLKA